MSVIQISKIQVRRGLKNSGIGVPQLSSAEFAWAIDTQELYIGNGSIAEGAPFVGNTKILTEHDNILELAGSYQFAANNTLITQSVPRPLQDKIDEIQVSVKDFGAVGDGMTDNVEAFENAARELFSNNSSTLKKVLVVPNGEYSFSRNLSLPSGAILRGETQLGSVLNINSNNIVFTTEDGLPVENFDSSTRPVNVLFENLTIKKTTGQLDITGLADSEFLRVRFTADYVLGDPIINVMTESAGVFWNNDLFGIRVNNITFDECIFESLPVAMKMVQTDLFSTEMLLENCLFHNCHTGIIVDGVETQRNDWQLNHCQFKNIYAQAYVSNNGRGTVIQHAKFRNCGNGLNSSNNPETPIVEFGEFQGNEIIKSSSDRIPDAEFSGNASSVAVPVALNSNRSEFTDITYKNIDLTDSLKPIMTFSTLSRCAKIEYILRLGVGIRKGTLMIGVDGDLSHVSISDNFTYSSSSSTSPGGVRMTEFQFSAELRDNNSDSEFDTVVLSYRNPIEHLLNDSTTIAGEPGDISLTVCYGV